MLNQLKLDDRITKRFIVMLKGNYFLNGRMDCKKECTVIDLSRTGVCINLQPEEAVVEGTVVHLEIFSKTFETVILTGTIKWLKKTESALIGGIKFSKLLNEKTLHELG